MNLRQLARQQIEEALEYGRITFRDDNVVELTAAQSLALAKAIIDGKINLDEDEAEKSKTTSFPSEFYSPQDMKNLDRDLTDLFNESDSGFVGGL